jgi:hypothetical protein
MAEIPSSFELGTAQVGSSQVSAMQTHVAELRVHEEGTAGGDPISVG